MSTVRVLLLISSQEYKSLTLVITSCQIAMHHKDGLKPGLRGIISRQGAYIISSWQHYYQWTKSLRLTGHYNTIVYCQDKINHERQNP